MKPHQDSASPLNNGNAFSANGTHPNGDSNALATTVPAPDAALTNGYGAGYNSGAGVADYDDAGEIDGFARVMRALSRRWPYALALSSLILAAGTYYALTALPLYRATTTIQDTSATSAASQYSSGVPVINDMLNGGQNASIQTQVAQLLSPWVEDGAKKRLSPKSRARVEAGSLLDTDALPLPGTSMITVSASAHHPEVAAEMANRICEEYIAESLQRNRDTMKGSVSYVKARLDEVEKQLASAQNDLKNYKQRFNTMDLNTETQQTVMRLAEAQNGLETVQTDRAASAAKLQKVRALLLKTPESKMVPSGIVASPEVEILKSKLSELKLQLADLQRTYEDAYPPVAALKGQIADVENRIKNSKQTQVKDWANVPNPVRAQLNEQLALLEAEVEASQSRQKSLQGDVAAAKARLQLLPQKELGMTKLMANVVNLGETQKNLANQFQTLRISEEAKVADARIMDPAKPPLAPVAPNRGRIIVYALMLGLMAGTGLAVVLDTLDTRVRDEDDAKRALGLPILASVPTLKGQPSSFLLRDDKPSILLEHFRMLRTNISFSGIDAPIKSVVVTSSVPNEGKSTCAANLAVAAALSGEQVILVDCDLRRPTAHKLFNLPNEVGLTNVAMGTATIESALRDTATPGLRVLTAGPSSPNLFKLISSSAMRATLQKLAATEGFVVFDTPPALGLADARVISVVADATLLVVSCNEATRQAVVQTRDLLAQSGTHLIGVLLNKVADPGGRGGYYSYYSNYLEEEDGGKAGKKALKAK